MKTQTCLEDGELNQARSKPDTVDRPVRTAHIFVHHCNSTQYCNTETVFIYISQTGRWRQCSQLVHSFVSPSVCPFVCYKTCKHDIENERNNLMQTGTRDPLDKGIKWSVWVSEGQSSRPHEAEIPHENNFRQDVSRTTRQT